VDAREVAVVGDERRLDLVGREAQVGLDHRLEHLRISNPVRWEERKWGEENPRRLSEAGAHLEEVEDGGELPAAAEERAGVLGGGVL
jgi:hypothetical protein